MSRPPVLVLCALAAASVAACDDPPKPSGGAASAIATAPTPVAPTPPATERPKPTTMPELIVDTDGPYLGGQRINLADAAGPEKLDQDRQGAARSTARP